MIRVIGQCLPEVGNKIDFLGFFDIFVNFLDLAGGFLGGNRAKKRLMRPLKTRKKVFQIKILWNSAANSLTL